MCTFLYAVVIRSNREIRSDLIYCGREIGDLIME